MVLLCICSKQTHICEDKTNTPHPVISHFAPSATSATSTTLDWGKPTRCKHVFFQGSKMVEKLLSGGNMVAIALLSYTATIFESALYVTSVFSVLQKREQILGLNYFLISCTEKDENFISWWEAVNDAVIESTLLRDVCFWQTFNSPNSFNLKITLMGTQQWHFNHSWMIVSVASNVI